jgi:hypothetical protein
MKHLLVACLCIVGLISATGAAAATEADLMVPINLFIDTFNKGDAAGAEATHVASGVVIIDEPAPHVWQGAGAFKAWLNDLMAHDKALGWTDGQMRLGKVTRADSASDRAYVVVEAFYSFKQNGVAMTEDPSFMTFALLKTAAGWRIHGWSFSGAPPHKAK